MQNMSSFAFLLVTICAVVFLLPTKMATSRTNCNLTVRNVTFQANSTLRSFNSPSYPRAYPVSITCTYLFTAPEGHRIELIFSNFHLEGNSPKCTNDYLEVRDGPTGKSTLLNRLCGAETPKPIISSANNIHLFFVSNDQFMFEGFSGTYRTVGEDEIAECTKETPSAYLFSSGYITTPEHPSKYPPSRECSWTLQAPPRHFMRVTFNTFQTQCPSDKVVVRDRDQNGQLLGEFCGEKKPPVFHGAKLWVRFTSDAIVTTAEEGFNVTYEMLPFLGYISDHCTGGSNKIINVNESSPGIIKSPWSPDFYPNNLNCVWRIRAREGRRIKLTINSLYLESPCNSDYAEVRDTSVGSTSPRGKFCAGFSSIVSASEEVMVQFVTGPNGRRKGFEMKYAVNAAFHVAQPPGGLLYLFAMLMIPVYYGVR